MPEPGGPGWAEFTPRELVSMAADGRLRSWSGFFAPRPASILEAARRGFPILPLLLWRAPDGVLWVLDGVDRVAAFQRALGVGSGADLILDAERGEIVERPRDPDPNMITLPLADVLGAEDIDELLRAEQLTGSYAQHVRAVTGIHSYRILAVVSDVPPSELPALGVLHDEGGVLSAVGQTLKVRSPLDAVPQPRSGPPARSAHPDLSPVAIARSAAYSSPSVGWAALLAAVGIADGPPVDAVDDLPEPLSEQRDEAVRAVRGAITFAEQAFRISSLGLIPQPGALGVLARLELLNQAGPLGSTGLVLLRRWLWRRALLTADELGGTRVRPDELDLRATSPEAAARVLLGTLPRGAPPSPQVHDVDLGSAWSRLHLLGMLSLRPRDLRTSLPVPDTDIALTPINGRIGQPLVSGAAADRLDNILLHPWLQELDETRRVLQDLDDDAVLASHALDRHAVDLLLADRTDEALAHRGHLMLDAIAQHWARMAEFGARDATPVAALFDDGGDDGAP